MQRKSGENAENVKKKSEKFDFSLFFLYLDTLLNALQHIVKNLWSMCLRDEVTLELRRTYIDTTAKHITEITCKAFLIAALSILEIAYRLIVEEHREH